jgi:hypothetical protein
MREHFKHQFGYVNIDSSNLYFTKTGNWSESKSLGEKTNRKLSKPTTIGGIIGILISIIVVIVNIYFLTDIIRKFGILPSIVGLIAYVALIVYLNYRHKYAPNFHIPLSKVIDISLINDSRLELKFLNKENIESTQLLKVKKTMFDQLSQKITTTNRVDGSARTN